MKIYEVNEFWYFQENHEYNNTNTTTEYNTEKIIFANKLKKNFRKFV